MTVDERAMQLVEGWGGEFVLSDTARVLREIAQAFRLVIDEEREACAAFVASIRSGGDADGVRWELPDHDCSSWGCAELEHIAQAIRGRVAP